MSSDLNVFCCSGHLTKDAELKRPGGTPLAETGIAINSQYNGKKDTIFLGIKVWGKYGETMHPYLLKGVPVSITGALKIDKWQDKDGTQRERHYILAVAIVLYPSGTNTKAAPQNATTGKKTASTEAVKQYSDGDPAPIGWTPPAWDSDAPF